MLVFCCAVKVFIFSRFLMAIFFNYYTLFEGLGQDCFFKDLSQRHILTTLEACSISAGFVDFQISPCLRPVSSIVFHEISHFPRDSLLMGFGGTLLPRSSQCISPKHIEKLLKICRTAMAIKVILMSIPALNSFIS